MFFYKAVKKFRGGESSSKETSKEHPEQDKTKTENVKKQQKSIVNSSYDDKRHSHVITNTLTVASNKNIMEKLPNNTNSVEKPCNIVQKIASISNQNHNILRPSLIEKNISSIAFYNPIKHDSSETNGLSHQTVTSPVSFQINNTTDNSIKESSVEKGQSLHSVITQKEIIADSQNCQSIETKEELAKSLNQKLGEIKQIYVKSLCHAVKNHASKFGNGFGVIDSKIEQTLLNGNWQRKMKGR